MCIYQSMLKTCCKYFDKCVTATIFVGGASTFTFTGLHYTGYMDNWQAMAAASIITFIAILGFVLSQTYKTRNTFSINTPQNTIIINNRREADLGIDSSPTEIPTAIEMISEEKKSLTNEDSMVKIKEIHTEWLESVV